MEWISVDERLPENDLEDVLVCLQDIRIGCEDCFYVAQAFRFVDRWMFPLDTNTDDLRIVAWMPLPPFPVEGDNNEMD